MSEPLNDFLETVGRHAENLSVTPETLGKLVRQQWALMREREGNSTSSNHLITNSNGESVTVSIPHEG